MAAAAELTTLGRNKLNDPRDRSGATDTGVAFDFRLRCTGSVVKIPIACTLTIEDATVRVEEWRVFFATHAHEVTASSPTEMAVRLGDDGASLIAAADLAGREQSCCNFFSFAIEITSGARWLRVSVPADAAPVLADLAGLAISAVEARPG